MKDESARVLESLTFKKKSILDAKQRNIKAINDNSTGLPDPNDRASAQTIVIEKQTAVDRLNKMSEAIQYLTDLLKKGWDMKCTRCEDNNLSADRVVEHLTSLCVECKAELEAKSRRGSGFFYQ